MAEPREYHRQANEIGRHADRNQAENQHPYSSIAGKLSLVVKKLVTTAVAKSNARCSIVGGDTTHASIADACARVPDSKC